MFDDLKNYQENYIYELNEWYSALKVDITEARCSYGMNLSKTIEWCFDFMSGPCYKCYIPVKDNDVTFINGEDKFRCKSFYLTDEVCLPEFFKKPFEKLSLWEKEEVCRFKKGFDVDKYWDKIPLFTRDLVCQYQKDFDYEKHWHKLTNHQKRLICQYQPNFDIEKHWEELTENQRDRVCKHQPSFDIDKHWDELTYNQREGVCKGQPSFDVEKHWVELTEHQRYLVCVYQPSFDVIKYWEKLNLQSKSSIFETKVFKGKKYLEKSFSIYATKKLD